MHPGRHTFKILTTRPQQGALHRQRKGCVAQHTSNYGRRLQDTGCPRGNNHTESGYTVFVARSAHPGPCRPRARRRRPPRRRRGARRWPRSTRSARGARGARPAARRRPRAAPAARPRSPPPAAARPPRAPAAAAHGNMLAMLTHTLAQAISRAGQFWWLPQPQRVPSLHTGLRARLLVTCR